MDSEILDLMIAEVFGMNLNCYFGVKSLETIVLGIRSMDTKAQIALFAAAGLGVYGYFRYVKANKEKKSQ